MNYGALGFVVGHEITHGFDDQGKQFDKDGNLKKWWQEETEKNFAERAQCIIDQYSNCTVKEVNLNINGKATQGENIADNGGIKEAYHAYEEWVKQNGEEKLLPGIDLNQKQLFWLSAANVWCSKYRPEILEKKVLVDPHSPGYFRIIVPFSNMEEFAQDFNCSADSRMNPTKRCAVW